MSGTWYSVYEISCENFRDVEVNNTLKVVISWLFTEVDVAIVGLIRSVLQYLQKNTSYERNSSDIYFRKRPKK